jgi:short-subunit dehydrogenase
MTEHRRGDGQTALVTGASGGIGLDLAECFARDGYDLILTARSEAALAAAGERLGKTYAVATAIITADLAAPAGVPSLASQIAARGLSVDVLVNNAGFGHAGAFDKSGLGDELGMVDLNIRALVALTHIYWPDMLAKKRGGVLNVASTAAFQPGPFMAVYYASKAFVLSFSEALWEEARGTGVHVSALCPGPTESNFRARAGTGSTRLATLGTPMASMPVARMGYEAFCANRRVMITGTQNAVMARLVPFTPRALALRMVRYLQSTPSR